MILFVDDNSGILFIKSTTLIERLRGEILRINSSVTSSIALSSRITFLYLLSTVTLTINRVSDMKEILKISSNITTGIAAKSKLVLTHTYKAAVTVIKEILSKIKN